MLLRGLISSLAIEMAMCVAQVCLDDDVSGGSAVAVEKTWGKFWMVTPCDVARSRVVVPVELGPGLVLVLGLAQHLPASFRPALPLFRLAPLCHRTPAQFLLAQSLSCGISSSVSFAAPLPPHVRVNHEGTASVADVLVADTA